MFFERYIKEPLQYTWSDPKKIFIGGIFQLISMFGIVFGFMLMCASAMSVLMDISTEMVLVISIGGSLIGFVSIIIGLVAYVFTGGYCVKVIENTLKGSFELPKWENYKELLKQGVYFFMGLVIIYAAFNLIASIFIMPFYVPMYATMFSESYSTTTLILVAIINLMSFGMAILQTLYAELAPINFVDKNDFTGFFDVKEIISKMSVEYVRVLVALSIVSILITIIVCVVLLIPAIFGAVSDNIILLMVSIALIVLAMPFLYMFFTVFWYRSITNYYLSKKESMVEKTDFENNE